MVDITESREQRIYAAFLRRIARRPNKGKTRFSITFMSNRKLDNFLKTYTINEQYLNYVFI